ncbi:DUF2207 domain-containing protein [Kineosporia succinea]|uniref:Uncharacterized protein (TIGR04222 family) n=1 Tax=Kineosporia succinea TaxID=84632 RepID=A0ABT9NYX9_9ACTN|nr:DUF2207 domain-containing protein [Kineosporia succinea]MDP9825344.1 uncharacterized protein (TIGR04222 family) [Kineosporia succinea]
MAVVLLGAAAVLASSGVARAAGGESITSYDVTMTLRADDSMRVEEKITYDFGDADDKHGITRDIPIEFDYDSDHTRQYPLSDLSVSVDGAASEPEEDRGKQVSLRIGDPGETVSGTHEYTIAYTLRGVVNDIDDATDEHQELYWNAIGSEWDVPIARATATVKGPAAVQEALCFRGQTGSTATCRVTVTQGQARFDSSGALDAGSGLTVVAAFPAGTFPDAAPILAEKWKIGNAFELSPLSGAGSAGALALIGGGALWLASRRGRDEKYLGLTPGLEPGYQQEQRVGLVSRRRAPVAVQFQPPRDMRPGELGTLIDERANVVDVTATIIDLAVRGYLRIEEVEQEGRFRKGDWKLVALQPPPGRLADYEQFLLDKLFGGRGQVLLSQLKQTFRSDLQKVQSMLYSEVTRQGWFRGNPSHVRIRWTVLGVLALLASIAAAVLLTVFTHFALVGVALVLGSIVLLVCAQRMPARTARGTALLAQAKGFELYLTKAEADEIRWQEQQDIFSRYLPFAIVFGVAERWAQVFDRLAASGAQFDPPDWYIGSMYGYYGFNYAAFGASVDSFSTTTSGSLSAATPSSSGGSGFGGGGFSGGGGGGGGGGSW